MSDVLDKICEDKRTHVAARKTVLPRTEAEAQARVQLPPRPFVGALKAAAGHGYGLIAEIKRASPSQGLIREDFDVAALARAYRDGGATCLSVLTDTPYFQGEDGYVSTAREAAELPVLRKDFMVDPYQIIESRALGADCVLLILAALEDGEARDMEALAGEWGMDVLIEVHDRDELERAFDLTSPLIGINNRNLKTLEVDLATCEGLAREVPPDRLLVAESGLHSPGDLARMAEAGASCFLIGESLMRQSDVEAATRALLRPPEAAVANG